MALGVFLISLSV